MPRGRPPKYPWAKWLDGGRHILKPMAVEDWTPTLARERAERGEDFYPDNVKVPSMRAECHAAANRKGGKVDSKIFGNTIHVRYFEE